MMLKLRRRKMTKAQAKRAGYTCATCGKHCPEEGSYGPPLFDPAAKWYCAHHLKLVWERWKARRRQ